MEELNQPWESDYKLYWSTEFPEGPQKIYMVGGNSDSSDFGTALNMCDAYDQDKKFHNWSEFATYFLENIEELDWNYVDGSYEDDGTWSEEGNFHDKVQNIKTPVELIKIITDKKHLDPVLLVRENDSLLQWLLKVRRVELFI